MPYNLADAVEDALNRSPKSSEFVEFENGSRCRVVIHADGNHTLEDDGDWFGSLHWSDGTERPKDCDGSAMKLSTRRGHVWWMPPTDIKGDSEAVKRLKKRVADYFLEQWYWVGIEVKFDSAPCKCCGLRKEFRESVWGVESDASVEYLSELAEDLLTQCKEDAE